MVKKTKKVTLSESEIAVLIVLIILLGVIPNQTYAAKEGETQTFTNIFAEKDINKLANTKIEPLNIVERKEDLYVKGKEQDVIISKKVKMELSLMIVLQV